MLEGSRKFRDQEILKRAYKELYFGGRKEAYLMSTLQNTIFKDLMFLVVYSVGVKAGIVENEAFIMK